MSENDEPCGVDAASIVRASVLAETPGSPPAVELRVSNGDREPACEGDEANGVFKSCGRVSKTKVFYVNKSTRRTATESDFDVSLVGNRDLSNFERERRARGVAEFAVAHARVEREGVGEVARKNAFSPVLNLAPQFEEVVPDDLFGNENDLSNDWDTFFKLPTKRSLCEAGANKKARKRPATDSDGRVLRFPCVAGI